MKSVLRWLLRLLLVVAVLIAGTLVAGWWKVRATATTPIAVNDPPLQLPQDAESLALGAYLFETRGCTDCHAANAAGGVVLDGGPLGRFVASNITPDALSARGYDADRIAAAIRHGVRPDGTPLVFMPSPDWHEMSDRDVAAMVAHMATLPSSPNDPGASTIGPLGWVLTLFGKFPMFPGTTLDHTPRARATLEPEVSVAYGGYVAKMCSGCHGPGFAGGPPLAPDTPPVADISTLPAKGWSEDDFLRALREGVRPDGSAIDPFMPWKLTAKMTETELRAMWAYFSQLSAG